MKKLLSLPPNLVKAFHEIRNARFVDLALSRKGLQISHS